jgi:hypothetical protein
MKTTPAHVMCAGEFTQGVKSMSHEVFVCSKRLDEIINNVDVKGLDEEEVSEARSEAWEIANWEAHKEAHEIASESAEGAAKDAGESPGADHDFAPEAYADTYASEYGSKYISVFEEAFLEAFENAIDVIREDRHTLVLLRKSQVPEPPLH